MRKMIVAAGLALAALGPVVAACSDPPKTGVVWGNEFNAGHFNIYLICGGYTSQGVCSVWVPAQYWVPDEWSLEIRNDDDPAHVRKGWLDVSQRTFNACPIDSRWPDCATAPHAAGR